MHIHLDCYRRINPRVLYLSDGIIIIFSFFDDNNHLNVHYPACYTANCHKSNQFTLNIDLI